MSRTIVAAAVTGLLISTISVLPALAEGPRQVVKTQKVLPSDTNSDGILDAPDTVAALSDAAAADKPVEDLSQRTETFSAVANPDGTFTGTDHSSAVRIERDGKWVDIDNTLAKSVDGNYRPRAAQADVLVSGGGTTEAARVTFENGETLAVTWPSELPKPTVDGAVATYKLSAATDLVVSVTGAGVAAHLRLNSRPTENDPVFNFGLKTKDLKVAETSGGGLKVTDGSNDRVGTTSTLAAWDARTDAAGDPAQIVALDADLSEVRTSGASEQRTLSLKAPDGYLADPKTVYPVIIDPDINAVNQLRDTYTRSGDTVPAGTLPNLIVGRLGDSTNASPARTFVQWENTMLAGKTITAASMNFYQYFGGSCSAKDVNIHPLTAGFFEGTTVDTNRPAVDTGTGASSILTANRGPSCSNGSGFVSASVLNLAKAWAKGPDAGGLANWGIQLNVPSASGSDATFERRFCSEEPSSNTALACSSADRVPFMKFTYSDPAPATPSTPKVVSSGPDRILSTQVTGVVGGNVRARFVVKQGTSTVFSGYTGYVASGSTASLLVPGLADGNYTAQAWSNDGAVSSSAGSSVKSFVVGLAPYGDFVPIESAELASTVNGHGLPAARIAGGTTATVQAIGELGLTPDVTGVLASIKTTDANSDGSLNIGASGASNSDDVASVPYKAGINGQVQIPIGVGADGKIAIASPTSPNSLVHLTIDIEGYFTTEPENGDALHNVATSTIFDSDTGNAPLAPGETRTVPVAGLGGVPSERPGGAVLLTLGVKNWAAAGAVTVFNADDEEAPEPNVEFASLANSTPGTSTTVAVELSMAGAVKIHNSSTAAVNVRLASQAFSLEPVLEPTGAPSFDVAPQEIQTATSPTSLQFPLTLPTGYTMSTSFFTGRPTVLDSAGQIVGTFMAPTATDHAGVVTSGTFTFSGTTLTQSTTLGSATTYPVAVAPTFEYNMTSDGNDE